MKDLDFDELDKAVNSLMAGVPKTPDPSDDTEKTLTISSPEQTSAAPMPTPAVPPTPSNPQPPTPVTSPAPRPAVTPASRRAGRFMDVVRPQAPPKKQEAAAKVSRQGVSLDPVTPIVKPEPASASPSAPVTDVSVKPKEAQSDWPDPIDMAGFSPPGVNPVHESKKTPNSPVSETEDVDTSPESPLSSPFLPDTKVEKRPLGANAVAHAGITDPADPKPSEQRQEGVDPSDEQLPATLEDTKSILPEELHSDLVAIESDTTSPDKEEAAKQEDSASWEVPEVADEPKRETPAPVPSKPSIPISIPQQYKEEASTGEQENGAIYDTDTYHKPLAHPAKQKSGWMWVVWILLILIVGAGGGAALYFLRLV